MRNHNKSNKLQDSQLWKDTVGAIQRVSDNYLRLLATYFQRMSRHEQEELISKYSWIISLGGVALIWAQIYYFFPLFLRIIVIPITLGLAYWFGKRIVSRIMIDRLSKYLND